MIKYRVANLGMKFVGLSRNFSHVFLRFSFHFGNLGGFLKNLVVEFQFQFQFQIPTPSAWAVYNPCDRGLLAPQSWGASKCAIRHVGPAMTVVWRWLHNRCFVFLREKSILARNWVGKRRRRGLQTSVLSRIRRRREREKEREKEGELIGLH